MVGLWTPKVKLCSNANQNIFLAILQITQIYLLFLITCLYFKTIENPDLEIGTLSNNPFYSLTWQGILDKIQVFNKKIEKPEVEALACTQSPEYLATLYFFRYIYLLSIAYTQALLRFLESLSMTISLLYLTASQLKFELWSHCQLNKFDKKQNKSSFYLRCQKYRKLGRKNLSHIQNSNRDPCFYSFFIDHQNFCLAQVLFFFSVTIQKTRHDFPYLLLILINTISIMEYGNLFKINR